MKCVRPGDAAYQRWPRLWRMVLVALCTLILCSCRGARRSYPGASWHPGGAPTLPEQAYTGVPEQHAGVTFAPLGAGAEEMEAGVPLPLCVAGPWEPPGIRQPWPQDEYLADGGDTGLTATVGAQGELRGLDLEDTVAHFDTPDGRTVVEPSNRVHIYSPRFGAVRQVVSLKQNEQRRRPAGICLPAKLVHHDAVETAQSHQQRVQTGRQIGQDPASICRTMQGDGEMSTALGPRGFQNSFKPYESPSAIREGVFEASEMAWLAQGVDAAVAWSHEQAVQVILDHQAAAAGVSDQGVDTIFTVGQPPGNAKLRVIKVASTQFALPGQYVDFTIRFDNVGDQVIGNVAIIDNLTTRLEYLPDSAQCSLPAEFSVQPNEGDSLVLRWQLSNPLEPQAGGIIRFRCRLR